LKKKLLDYIIILLICFLVAPVALYFALNSSEFSKFNLYYDKSVYIGLYLKLSILGLILFVLIKAIDKILFKMLTKIPTEKSKLISIEKINIESFGISLSHDESTTLEEIYSIKFKHNDEIIDITVSKESVKNDLTKEESPYVEYQHINLIKIFNKFLNIKVHTKNKR
jgi:hypothetical protein